LQYFSKKKLVLPEGYFVNSSQIPLAKEVNKLLANCGCETFPTKILSEAIQKSNFFFTIQNELKNALDHDGPALINILVRRAENCYPMVPPGKSNAQMVGYVNCED